MPTTVSFQLKNKKEHTIVAHKHLVIFMQITSNEKCACVRLYCFCVIRDCVRVVVSANARKAFSDIPLVVNVEGVLRHRR